MLKKQKQEKDAELTHDELAAFYSNVDHALYSQVNKELMENIVSLFNNAL